MWPRSGRTLPPTWYAGAILGVLQPHVEVDVAAGDHRVRRRSQDLERGRGRGPTRRRPGARRAERRDREEQDQRPDPAGTGLVPRHGIESYGGLVNERSLRSATVGRRPGGTTVETKEQLLAAAATRDRDPGLRGRPGLRDRRGSGFEHRCDLRALRRQGRSALRRHQQPGSGCGRRPDGRGGRRVRHRYAEIPRGPARLGNAHRPGSHQGGRLDRVTRSESP